LASMIRCWMTTMMMMRVRRARRVRGAITTSLY
jgi:hypothetical protein